MKHPHPTILMVLPIILLAGCDSKDERLVRIALESTQQQAQQNRASSELNREVAENHRRVVEAVEQSRQDNASLERDLQLQHDRLDEEHRSLANERHREMVDR